MQTDTTQLQKLRGKQNLQRDKGLWCVATEESLYSSTTLSLRMYDLLLRHLILDLLSPLACHCTHASQAGALAPATYFLEGGHMYFSYCI